MNEPSNHMINLGKENAAIIQHYFRKPGGRKYLENITLILINTLPHSVDEKEEMYRGFVRLLDHVEGDIRQREGDEILSDIFSKRSE